MAKCDHHHRHDIAGSLPHHDRHHQNHHHRHFRLWNSFSAASFRRKLLATLSCGAISVTSSKKTKPSSTTTTTTAKKPEPKPETRPDNASDRAGSNRTEPGRLFDLLNLSSSSCASHERREKEEEEDDTAAEESAEEVRKKEERLEELRAAVRRLQSDDVEERERGAKMVRRLAKEDGEARSTLAMMGAIPPLVSMINHDHHHNDQNDDLKNGSQIEALYALLNLGIGNDMNKAAVVQAGAVHKMLKKIDSSKGSLGVAVSEAIVANFLALSALDSNKVIIGTSGAIPFLVSTIEDSEEKSSSQARQDSLRALYNLSISPANIALVLETNLTRHLISSLGLMEMSERILSILSNIVSTPEGRKAISSIPDALPILIDVLNWTDSPGCQEKASYVLMVMAHKSYSDRQAMIEAGIGSALLELTLLGSTLAQKRASRILECLRVDKGKQISQCFNSNTTQAVSAPIFGSSSTMTNFNKEEEAMMSEEKKAVKQLVQQSLQNNMKRIVKRANLPQDFVPSEHLKSLSACSTSKSLPF